MTSACSRDRNLREGKVESIYEEYFIYMVVGGKKHKYLFITTAQGAAGHALGLLQHEAGNGRSLIRQGERWQGYPTFPTKPWERALEKVGILRDKPSQPDDVLGG